MAKKTATTKTSTPKTSNLMEGLLAKKGKNKAPVLRAGAEVEATIVSVERKNVLFDVGGKALALLGERELKDVATYMSFLRVGEKITVRVVTPESKDGYPVVSLSKFFQSGKWKILEDKKEKEETVDVMCGEYGKGGVFVDCMGIRGVIPKIQLSAEYMDAPEKLVGQKIKVKVLEVDETKNRLVVSQKAVDSNFSQKQIREGFEKIKVGDTYEAKVLGISEFGVFCEIDGVEGLIHISEVSWEKVEDANQYVRPGQTIKVVVVDKNLQDSKLNLSIKRLQPDPWSSIEQDYPKDKLIKGTVIRQERYGYFVRLAPGVEGLIHISKLRGNENFKIGDQIEVYVERINKMERRMSLVIPQKETPIMYR